MYRPLIGGIVIVIATTASADHKLGHTPGGGGGGTTLGDLNCATNQIAKFNGFSGAWECAPDMIGGDSYIVVDSSNQVIPHSKFDDNREGTGFFSATAFGNAIISVDVQYRGQTATVSQLVDENGVLNSRDWARTMVYESSDCSGQPFWVLPAGNADPSSPPPVMPSSMLATWQYSEIIIDPFAVGGPNTDARLIFFPDSSQITANVQVESRLDVDGNCIESSGLQNYSIPITEAQFTDFRDDLYVLHPPPYRVCPYDDSNCINGLVGP